MTDWRRDRDREESTRDLYQRWDREDEYRRDESIRQMYEDWDRKDARERAERDRNLAAESFKRGDLASTAGHMGMTDMAVRIARGDFSRSKETRNSYAADAFRSAERKLEAKEYFAARLDLDTVIIHEEFNPRAYYLRGVCRFYLDEYKEAFADFAQARLKGAPAEKMLAYSATCQMRLKNFAEAEANFTRAINSGMNTVQTYYDRGTCRIELNRFDDATTDFSEAAQLEPKNPNHLYMLGVACVQAQQPQSAAAALDRAEKLGWRAPYPYAWRETFLYLWRADAHVDLSKPKLAIRDLDEAIARDPDLAGAYSRRGQFRVQENDYQAAIRDFKEVIRIEPRKITGHLDCGDAHLRLGEYDEALSCFDHAQKLAPKSPRPYCYKADCLQRMGQAKQALEAIDKSLERGRSYIPARMIRARCLLNLKRWQNARGELEGIVKEDSDYPTVHFYLGRALEGLGDRDGAIHELGLDIQNHPKEGMAYLRRAELHERAGKRSLAIKDFEMAAKFLKAQKSVKQLNRALAGASRARLG